MALLNLSTPELLQRPASQPGAPLFGAPRPERPRAPANPARKRRSPSNALARGPRERPSREAFALVCKGSGVCPQDSLAGARKPLVRWIGISASVSSGLSCSVSPSLLRRLQRCPRGSERVRCPLPKDPKRLEGWEQGRESAGGGGGGGGGGRGVVPVLRCQIANYNKSKALLAVTLRLWLASLVP